MDPLAQDPLDDGNVHDEIARIEARIEALTESIERCRKLALTAKIVLASGALLFALMLIGALPFGGLSLVAGIAATLGGIVLTGSNASTWRQIAAALAQAEARRAELIDRIALQTVVEQADSPPWLPRSGPTLDQ